MYHRFDLAKISVADFVVRTGYQMGKTPLLPIFAASLGAEAALLGLIVSVSTLTGMVLKPTVGVLSDRWGRCGWLLVGILFFAGTPFLYRFVQTQEELLALRLLHGLATAIFGPVSLAFVAEQCGSGRGERLGWFGMARSGGYVLGPALGGWLLLSMEPGLVFTAIGLLSCVALIPTLFLHEPASRARRQYRLVLGRFLKLQDICGKELKRAVLVAFKGAEGIYRYIVTMDLPSSMYTNRLDPPRSRSVRDRTEMAAFNRIESKRLVVEDPHRWDHILGCVEAIRR